MAIINQRWPSDLAPRTCKFTRSRNDIRLRSPRTREPTVIRQGRPLWTCDLTWELPNNDKLAKLRYWLEGLDGFAGSVQLWDFAAPAPINAASIANGNIPNFNAVGTTAVFADTMPVSTTMGAQGQYVQIGRRIYTLTSACTTTVTGTAFVNITPGLLAETAPGDVVRFYQAACEMELAEQDFDEQATAGDGLITVSARFIETVNDR